MATFAGNPAATALTGLEIVPITQGGVDKRTTTQEIADLSAVANIVAGTGIDVSTDSAGDTVISLDGSAGDVVGPASSVTDTVARFDGTTGKLLKAGGKTIPELMLQSIIVACSDETTNLTAGVAKVTFRMPYAFTLLSGAAGVRASLTAAQTAGSILTVDINENTGGGATSILSTKLTIDNSELTSTTAATPAVISDTSLANDSEITIDIDQVGTPLAKGLKVTLIGYPT